MDKLKREMKHINQVIKELRHSDDMAQLLEKERQEMEEEEKRLE